LISYNLIQYLICCLDFDIVRAGVYPPSPNKLVQALNFPSMEYIAAQADKNFKEQQQQQSPPLSLREQMLQARQSMYVPLQSSPQKDLHKRKIDQPTSSHSSKKIDLSYSTSSSSSKVITI
jgi:hypothetical protein